jgi:O-antigen/teichoic acid export membrane protein
VNPFQRNLLANFAGVGWTIVVQLLCVPFYIGLMGIEGYALVGFYLMLQAMLQVLDLGLTPTMNREMARYSVRPDQAREMRDLARTFEAAYWIVGLGLGVVVMLLASTIATRWVNTTAIPTEHVTAAVAMMGALLALQWPLSLYQGGLLGLQRQVRLNAIRAAAATLSGVGAVAVLRFVSGDILAFFAWQMAVATLHVALIAWTFWRSLPARTPAARFNIGLIRRTAPFATGMTGIAFFAMILVQMDKVVLSKLLPLEAFGYYVLAATMANGLQLFIMPIFTAVFPRLSSLVANDDDRTIRRLYHDASQLMAALVVPLAAVLALFSFEIVSLWTGDAATAARTAPILSLFVIGTAINGLMCLPYALQLAFGWTSVGLALTVSQVVVFLPLMIWAAGHHGAVGAAGVWTLLNLAYLIVGVPLTHRRLLVGEAGRWMVADIGLPMVGALSVVVVGRLVAPEPASSVEALIVVGAIAIVAVGVALALAPQLRSGMLQLIQPARSAAL